MFALFSSKILPVLLTSSHTFMRTGMQYIVIHYYCITKFMVLIFKSQPIGGRPTGRHISLVQATRYCLRGTLLKIRRKGQLQRRSYSSESPVVQTAGVHAGTPGYIDLCKTPACNLVLSDGFLLKGVPQSSTASKYQLYCAMHDC